MSDTKKRKALEYANNDVSIEYINDALRCGPLGCTLSGAGRKSTVNKTNAAIPSNDAVEEMRDWSIECKL